MFSTHMLSHIRVMGLCFLWISLPGENIGGSEPKQDEALRKLKVVATRLPQILERLTIHHPRTADNAEFPLPFDRITSSYREADVPIVRRLSSKYAKITIRIRNYDEMREFSGVDFITIYLRFMDGSWITTGRRHTTFSERGPVNALIKRSLHELLFRIDESAGDLGQRGRARDTKGKSAKADGQGGVGDQQSRQAILQAKDSRTAGKLYKRWFSQMTERDFERLRGNPSIGIALQAAWETFGKPSSRVTTPNPKRFLGFLEGRTGVQIPIHWESGLVYKSLKKHPKLLEAAEEDYSRRYPRLFSAGWPADHSDVLTQAAIRTGGVIVKTRFTQFGDHYPIACNRPKADDCIWEATVWAVGEENITFARTGAWSHDVELVATKEIVAIFGRASGELYVEGFNLKTGASLFRFSTNYWGYRGDRTGPDR